MSTRAELKGCCEIILKESMDYPSAVQLQDEFVRKIAAGEEPEKLILLEHPHVITLGRGFHRENLLFSTEWLNQHGVDVQESGRGGDVTYHGPGQLVGYPLLDISKQPDLHLYLRNIEELMINVVSDFGIHAERKAGLTGIWVNNEKIGAIGVRVTRWVTSHGFALNVNTDLKYFEYIVPCGIREHGVTSLHKLLGSEVPMAQVRESVVTHFEQIFQRRIIPYLQPCKTR